MRPRANRQSPDEIGCAVEAPRSRTVTPSLIPKKLSAHRQENSLAAALRELGRVERTLFTLRRSEDPGLRRLVSAGIDKGEARNSPARADAPPIGSTAPSNRQIRAAALDLVTAAIVTFDRRSLGRAVTEPRRRDGRIDDALGSRTRPGQSPPQTHVRILHSGRNARS